jgi:uncharacterized protein (DUF927 family)
VKYANQIGWEEDQNGNIGNIYVSPQTTKEYVFDPHLKGYTAAGDKEKEKETVIKILKKGSILGLGYLGAVASLLIKPLENVGARNFIVFFEGKAGKGKTTTAKFGLSLFGNPSKLMTNMNATSTGAEILFSTRKDSLVIMDELNTAGYHHISEHLIKLIYDFENGIGKTRGTKQINLREYLTYRGVLFFTSETSFVSLLRKTDKNAMGSYRRSIIVNYSDQNIDKNDIETIYNSIYQHHGNLLRDITDYIANNIDFLKERYTHHREQLKPYKFEGQDNHFALLYCAIDVLEAVLNIDLSTPKNTITDTLGELVQQVREDYQEQTEITREKLEQAIRKFIGEKNSCFPSGMENSTPPAIYGKTDGEILYLTPLGLEKLSERLKIDEKSLKRLFVDLGMAETDGNRLLKNSSFSIAGKRFNAFKIQLSEVGENQNQDINQDDIAI